ncbi:MAG: hypothetical protein GXY58_03480 [Planctomycetaceae bacterium]|nr:hypothetical protein [Planctomycetaceae bacterium]
MQRVDPSIRINVDCTNPGQFFACCGLLELADRLWPGAEGWFEQTEFCIVCDGTLRELMKEISDVEIESLKPDDRKTSPLRIAGPFVPLRVDWWNDLQGKGKDLKVWAGSMEGVRITLAMRNAIRQEECWNGNILNYGVVVYSPEDSRKKVEPFYFDARRALNAHSRDVGFSPNSLSLKTTAYPAVEFFCLVGLQRIRPVPTKQPQVFDYFTWSRSIPVNIVPAVASGLISSIVSHGYRFQNWFRTGQRKHKAFRPAIPLDQA